MDVATLCPNQVQKARARLSFCHIPPRQEPKHRFVQPWERCNIIYVETLIYVCHLQSYLRQALARMRPTKRSFGCEDWWNSRLQFCHRRMVRPLVVPRIRKWVQEVACPGKIFGPVSVHESVMHRYLKGVRAASSRYSWGGKHRWREMWRNRDDLGLKMGTVETKSNEVVATASWT